MAVRAGFVAAMLLLFAGVIEVTGNESGLSDLALDGLDRPSDYSNIMATGGLGWIAASNEPEAASYGRMFLRGWVPLTGTELALLGITAILPKDWTGWPSRFAQDGMDNLGRAYTSSPVWDDDAWFHNYVGHPYGGNVYHNAVRCQGASVSQSFLFATVLSFQWEYLIEAVAERPSTQDLIITPIVGTLFREAVHRMTLGFKSNGTDDSGEDRDHAAQSHARFPLGVRLGECIGRAM